MKISKLPLKILVVLVLAAGLMIPSTFSWYNHNGSQTGNSMKYTRENLPVSAGTVTIETKKYYTVNNKLWYDTKGNKKYDPDDPDPITSESSLQSRSVAASSVQYYGTTITNTGSAPAYVNLYLRDFTNSPTVKIGTLQPSLTDKGLSSSVHLANKNIIRVYFQCDLANNWNDSNAKKYVVYKTKDGTQSCVEITTQTPTNLSNSYTYNNLTNTKTYYVDLAANTTEFYFASDGNKSGFDVATLTPSIAWYRTQTITNVQSEMCYFLTGVADDTTYNAQYATKAVSGGVSVKTYFDTATINKNQHAYVTLNKGTNYTGASATYALTEAKDEENNALGISNNSVADVISINTNAGMITTASGFDTDYTAEVTTTITGSLGDTTTVTTAVSNPGTIAGVPVALNVKVPGGTQAEPGTAEIVWYIDNSAPGSTNVSFNSIYYTK